VNAYSARSEAPEVRGQPSDNSPSHFAQSRVAVSGLLPLGLDDLRERSVVAARGVCTLPELAGVLRASGGEDHELELPWNRFLIAIVVCAIVGALVALGMHSVLKDSTGFLADNRTAVVGAAAAVAAMVVVRGVVRRGGKSK
jgi:hypothetical protein